MSMLIRIILSVTCFFCVFQNAIGVPVATHPSDTIINPINNSDHLEAIGLLSLSEKGSDISNTAIAIPPESNRSDQYLSDKETPADLKADHGSLNGEDLKTVGSAVEHQKDRRQKKKIPLNGFDENIANENIHCLDWIKSNETIEKECTCDKQQESVFNQQLKEKEQLNLNDLFLPECKYHRRKDEMGEHIVLYHGTHSGQLKSFKESGIGPIGNGHLGPGFYMTSNRRFAMLRAVSKSDIGGQSEPIVIEFKVCAPKDISVSKNGLQELNEQSDVLQSSYRDKFLFKTGVLHLLILEKVLTLSHGV